MPKPILQDQIGALWNTVSLLNLLSKVNPSDAKEGEFQDSLELIAKSLTETVNQIQDFVEGGENA
ncbi:hypothetical protein [Bibersteinia trehalosi]|uniref:hypothetical protein n=1 Tax=Bibersteinia trehalosi TaxID=47735 RepID=UPI002D78C22D|nr:hypothetical protein [Bibersteinia trehalosi]